jgi:hypothetical protein
MKESCLQNCCACCLFPYFRETNCKSNYGWLPKKTVMRFFDYGETQMRQLEKEFNLETSKIKARKFYSVKSIINLIEQHKQIKK